MFIQAQDAIDETREVDVGTTSSSRSMALWHAHPTITYLKPPLPGASLDNIVFLHNERWGRRKRLLVDRLHRLPDFFIPDPSDT